MFGYNRVARVRDYANQDPESLKVTSIFYTLQGEGPFSGKPCIFVRLTGCHLQCAFCFGVVPGRHVPYVTISNGPKKKLTKVGIGDRLLTFDKDQTLVETIVTNVIQRQVDRWLRITIDGTQYFVTEEHPFFTVRGLVFAENLCVGDMVLHASPNLVMSHKKLGDNNPMKRPEVVKKMVDSTDQAAKGRKLSSTIRMRSGSWGHTTTDAQRQAASIRWSGENNPNWAGGSRLPVFEAKKRQIQGLFLPCERCHQVKKLEVHHRDGDRDNDCEDNMECICHRCHSIEHHRGYNFWQGSRKDGKQFSGGIVPKNGLEVQAIKLFDRAEFPPSVRPKPLTVYNISCSPYPSYLIDNMWVHNCDTYFDSGEVMPFHGIVDAAKAAIGRFNAKHGGTSRCLPSLLVITGGEPCLQPSLVGFIEYLFVRYGVQVQIETTGTIDCQIPSQYDTFVVCSPKLNTRGEPLTISPTMLDRIDCMKCVISKVPPYNKIPDFVLKWRDRHPDRPIYVSPMNIYRKQPVRLGPVGSLIGRSEVDERVSFWTEGLLDREANQENHEYAAVLALRHQVQLTLQMHLYASLP